MSASDNQFPPAICGVGGDGGTSVDAILSVRNLAVEFKTDQGPTRVTDGVSFDVKAGTTVGLVGESGSGKTVTALSILGLLPKRVGRVAEGSIFYSGENLTLATPARMRELRGANIAMIFQEPMSSLNPVFTVGEQIAESVRTHRRVSRKHAWDRAVEVLDIVGIASADKRAHQYPHSFSGGMRQRVMIAMALACEPTFLIADEPTTALDATIQAGVLETLKDLQSAFGMAILLVTHDFGVVAEMCDDVVVMYAGQVVEQGAVANIFDNPLHPYTEGLLQSMPQVGTTRERLSLIPGTVPPPWAMPRGCRFNTRCSYSVDVLCTSRPVPLYEMGDGKSRCVRVHEILLKGTK